MNRRVRVRPELRTEIDLERLAVALLGLAALLRDDQGDLLQQEQQPDEHRVPDRDDGLHDRPDEERAA